MAEPTLNALESDQLILDAAFFVLIFGQLENRINRLAEARLPTKRQREQLRQLGFERRLSLALKGTGNDVLGGEIAGWYDLRNRAAHGDAIASGFNIASVVARAREIERQVSAIGGGADASGG